MRSLPWEGRDEGPQSLLPNPASTFYPATISCSHGSCYFLKKNEPVSHIQRTDLSTYFQDEVSGCDSQSYLDAKLKARVDIEVWGRNGVSDRTPFALPVAALSIPLFSMLRFVNPVQEA